MASKKAREEVTKKLQPTVATSNKEGNKEIDSVSTEPESPSKKDDEVAQTVVKTSEDAGTKVSEEKHEVQKPELHVIASDRLNKLISEANELGITDIVQILNSDKYGQFYMVYRA
jgi:hypothetical protein